MRKIISVACFIVFVLFIVSFSVCFQNERAERLLVEEQAEGYEYQFSPDFVYNGVYYMRNHNVDTVIFLGIDKELSDISYDSFGEAGRADTILLFVFDHNNKVIYPIQIPRDTMVDVIQYNSPNDQEMILRKQIAVQHSLGRNPHDANNITRLAIESSIEPLKINCIVSTTVDGIAPIVDAIGGIEVQDSAGDKRILNGAEAHDFVRYRNINENSSNIERMSRQIIFIKALQRKIFYTEEYSLEEIRDIIAKYTIGYLPAELIYNARNYTIDDRYGVIPGSMVHNDLSGNDEYYIDESKTKELILSLQYVETAQ